MHECQYSVWQSLISSRVIPYLGYDAKTTAKTTPTAPLKIAACSRQRTFGTKGCAHMITDVLIDMEDKTYANLQSSKTCDFIAGKSNAIMRHNAPKHQKCFLPLSLGADGGRLAVCTSKGIHRILHLGHSANQEWKMQKRSKTKGTEFVVSLMISNGVFLENPFTAYPSLTHCHLLPRWS